MERGHDHTSPGLRAFALISMGAVAMFLLLDLHTRSTEALGPLVLVYALHTVLPVSVLLITATFGTPRRLERLAPLLVGGQALTLDLYFALSPDRAELVASGLTCLLVASSVLFAWAPRRVVAIAALTCLGFTLTGALVSVGEAPFELALANVLVGCAVAVVSADVLGDFRAQLASRGQELRSLSGRLMSAQEEERRRLSRELHDELGQSLTAVGAYLWLAERDVPEQMQNARERIGEARRMVAKTLGEMRELSQLLCPPVLALYGLVPSLEAQLRTFKERHGIGTKLTVEGVSGRLPSELETALYRITQEALTNVARHAHAHSVRVRLVADEFELRLQIDDDGIGLPARHGKAGMVGTGLLGITERARALGGSLTISSRHGMHLCVRVPQPRRGASPAAPASGSPSRALRPRTALPPPPPFEPAGGALGTALASAAKWASSVQVGDVASR